MTDSAAKPVYGFYKNEYPDYSDELTSELQSPATAAELNGLVSRLRETVQSRDRWRADALKAREALVMALSALAKIENMRYDKRDSFTEANAMKALHAVNNHLVEVYDIAKNVRVRVNVVVKSPGVDYDALREALFLAKALAELSE